MIIDFLISIFGSFLFIQLLLSNGGVLGGNLNRNCLPSGSSEIPALKYPIDVLWKAFERIEKYTEVVNRRRQKLTESQSEGKLVPKLPQLNIGIQLEALGRENFAQVLPGIDLALEDVQNQTDFHGVFFKVVPILHLTATACDSLAVLERFRQHDIDVLLGPINDFTVANAARYSGSLYKIPIITPGGIAYQLGDKQEYSTLTRVYFSYGDLTWLLNATLRHHGWTVNKSIPIGLYAARTAKLKMQDTGHTSLTGVFQQQSLNKFLIEAGYKVFQVVTETHDDVADQFLKRLPDITRVVVLCTDPRIIRDIMLEAHDLGLTNGDYTFFNIDLYSSMKNLENSWYKSGASVAENERARQAFRALMTITLKRPNSTDYRNFSARVRERSMKDYHTEFEEEPNTDKKGPVRPFIGLFHDAVKIYTTAVKKAIQSGISIRDGDKICKLMWNKTFHGVIGTLRIDANGDRNGDFSLLDLDVKTGKFKAVYHYFGKDHEIYPIRGGTIDWVNDENRPPPGIPHCGFDGSLCQTNYALITSVVGVMVFCVITIIGISLAVYFYRRAELQSLSWIIDWTDLNILDKRLIEKIPLLHQQPSDTHPDHSYLPPTLSDENQTSDEKSPYSTEVNYEISTLEKRRRSTFHSRLPLGILYSDRPKSNANNRATDEQQTPDSISPTSPDNHPDGDYVQIVNPKSRLHQRFARRSRAAHDETELVPYRGGRGQEGGYKKHPSFDYSWVTTKYRLGGTRKLTPNGEYENNPLLHYDEKKKKKDSQVSRFCQDGIPFKLRGRIAMYKGSKVYLNPIQRQHRLEANKETAMVVNKVKDLTNDHICRMFGVCLEPSFQCMVLEYCSKGSLFDFLKKEQFTMDWLFKLSLMQDICRGMTYLHQLMLVHGHLKSSNCLLDSRFSVKLTGFGLEHIRTPSWQRYEYGTRDYYHSLLWTAPELIPNNETDSIQPTYKGDVYSFAIICQELIYRKGPFYIGGDEDEEEHDEPSPKTIMSAVKERRTPPYRPTLHVKDEGSEEVIKLISNAWDDDSNKRPDFRTIGKQIGTDSNENLIDNLLNRMQNITANLEVMVDRRTQEYMEEKKRAEDLLYSMLPKTVASQLIKHKSVEAESFEMVTIYFSDIVRFTELSASSTAMEVVTLLNQLYTLFDGIIGHFRVYKVETIGDAYMVASGLPKRIGDDHAREIARMSIAFLKSIFLFQIPHRPDRQLELRIGIHSGPVCAGVVGQRMPRYCLFGDTVNTSSRMESNGLPLKIHISEVTFNLLRTFKTFVMTKRGSMEMKGKGEQTTYWLHGEENVIVDPVPPGVQIIGGPFDGADGPLPAVTQRSYSYSAACPANRPTFSETTPNDSSNTWPDILSSSTPPSSPSPSFAVPESSPTSLEAAQNNPHYLTTGPNNILMPIPEGSPRDRYHSTDESLMERCRRRVGVCHTHSTVGSEINPLGFNIN